MEIIDVELEGTTASAGLLRVKITRLRVGVWRVTVDLFAGIPVSDYQCAIAWYGRLLGFEPAFLPNATEAVWEHAEHRYLYIEELPEGAGHALHTVFVDDLDERVDSISARGIEPASWETYGNGVRKVIYCDPDGNEVSLGGAPLE